MSTWCANDNVLRSYDLDYRDLLDVTTTDALLIHDERGRIVYANPHACSMFGYDKDELESGTIADFSEEPSTYPGTEARSRIGGALEHGVSRFRWHGKRKDGRSFWTAVTLQRQTISDKTWLIALIRQDERRECAEGSWDKSEEISSKIFRGSRSAMVIAEPDTGRIVDANESWVAMCGITRQQTLAKTTLELGLWDPAEDRSPGDREAVGLGGNACREVLLATRSGRQPTQVSVRSISVSDGHYLLWEFHDLTALRCTEQAGREREDRLQAVSTNLTGGMIYQIVVRADGTRKFTYLSDSVKQLYGVSPEEGMADARLIYQRICPEDIERLRAAEATAARDCTTFRIEARVVEPSGKERWSSFVATPKKLEDGVVFDGIEFVITASKRAQEALAESERNLQEAQHLASLGSWTLDLIANRLYWSDEVYRIFELDPKAFNASFEGFLAAIHPDDREVVQRTYLESVKTRVPYAIEHRLQMADGRIKYVQELGNTRFGADGTPLRSVGTVRDITKEKLAALEHARLETQLHHAQRLESIGQLAGGVAHDFNNMLGVILGHVEFALNDLPSDHPVRADLLEIDKAAQRSKELTRRLLAFARKQTVAPRVLDMNEVVESMLKMLQRLIGEDIDLMWRPGPNVWPVKIDPSQLDQILVNLCVNSRDAIADVGKITIETANATFDAGYCASHVGFAPGNYVRLSLSDDGCGMDHETLGHIFEPFFTTKPAGAGTGLGLAMVYGVVRQNNGFINVYSEPGQGTTFAIYLPKHIGNEEIAHVRSSVAKSHAGNETILLVEDDPSLLSIITLVLRRQGYTVLPAHGPCEALRLAKEHASEIRLLISDVVMPDMNGRELARRVEEIIPALKRLFMSGYTANVIAHRNVLDVGVNFIQKPFSEAEFASKVREVLDAKAAPAT